MKPTESNSRRRQIGIAILIAVLGIAVGYYFFLRAPLSEQGRLGSGPALNLKVPQLSVDADKETLALAGAGGAKGLADLVKEAGSKSEVEVRVTKDTKSAVGLTTTSTVPELIDYLGALGEGVKFTAGGQLRGDGPLVVVDSLEATSEDGVEVNAAITVISP